ncbi:MAG: helix-turn-helix domain-containing protein [Bacteroidota bacterium]
MTLSDLIICLGIGGMSISGLLSVVFLKSRKRPYVYLGVIFLSICWQLTEEVLWLSHKILSFPFFAESSEGSVFLIAPCLFLYTLHSKQTSGAHKEWIHIIPAIFGYLVFSPLYLSDTSFHLCYIHEEIFEILPTTCHFENYHESLAMLLHESVLDILLIFQFILYAVLIINNWTWIFSNKSRKTKQTFQQWGRILIAVFVCAIGCSVVDILYFTTSENYFTCLFLSGIVYVFGLTILNHSVFLANHQKSTVYAQLSTQEKDRMYQLLLHYLKEENNYSNPDLSLKLANEDLNLSYNQLSYILNEKGTNFKQLLNQSRIDHAIAYLSSDLGHTYSMEGLGKQVGYKSKTTFYQHFKARTGQTPKEFLQMCTKSSNST